MHEAACDIGVMVMTILYTKLARAYHEMYQSIFDYKSDFRFYDGVLKSYGCSSILEIGCGSGNLASYFKNAGYQYTGLDMSVEMLEIAREINEGTEFVNGDMRSLDFIREFDSVIITGRSFTYMISNKDVLAALDSVHRNLKKEGILVFDNFNAENIFLNFKEEFDNQYEFESRKYRRISKSSMNLETGWTWNWEATYHIQEEGKTDKVFYDKAVLRAFTEDELEIFLTLSNFKVKEIMKVGRFAAVAEK